MNQTLSYMYPKPGWGNCNQENISASQQLSFDEVVGKHCILELYECNYAKLNDEAFVRTIVTTASKVAGAKLLNMITHRFQPQGLTGLALLAESHISIHTWPESRYAAIDIFTCGHKTMPEKACKFLAREFDSKSYSLKSFLRDTPVKLLNVNRKP